MVDFGKQVFKVFVLLACTQQWPVCDMYKIPETNDLSVRHPCQPNPCRNSGICHVDEEAMAFMCACPLEHRGDICNETMKSCASLVCQEARDCILTPTGAICICTGSISGRLCRAVDVHQEPLDQLVYTLSNDSNEQIAVFLGTLVAVKVLISLALAIHCCRVNRKRNKLRDEYKHQLSNGDLPADLPPDWFNISSAICKETLICCNHCRTSPDNGGHTTSAEAPEFGDDKPPASEIESHKEKEEAFDRLMSYNTSLALKSSIVKNRAPRRVKSYRTTSRIQRRSPADTDPTNHDTHTDTSHNNLLDHRRSCPEVGCERLESCRNSPDFGCRHPNSGELHRDSNEGVCDTDATGRDVHPDEYVVDFSNEGYDNLVDEGMIFDENIPLLTSTSTKKQRSKSSRKELNENANMAFDDGIEQPHSRGPTRRYYKNLVSDKGTHNAMTGNSRTYNSNNNDTTFLDRNATRKMKVKQHKSAQAAAHHLQKHKVKGHPHTDTMNEEGLPLCRLGGAALRTELHATSDAADEQTDRGRNFTSSDKGTNKVSKWLLANPGRSGAENKHTFKECSYCASPHFVDTSCNDTSDNSRSNNTCAVSEVTGISKSNRSEQRTPVIRETRSCGKYRRYLLSTCMSKGHSSNTRDKLVKKRKAKRHSDMIRSKGFENNTTPECVPACNTGVSFDVSKDFGRATDGLALSQKHQFYNTNLNANTYSDIASCNNECIGIYANERVFKRHNNASMISMSDKRIENEDYSEPENVSISCTNDRRHSVALTSSCTVEGQRGVIKGAATEMNDIPMVDMRAADHENKFTRNKQDVSHEQNMHMMANSTEEDTENKTASKTNEITCKASAHTSKPSLNDVACNCKLWLEQAETIIANLSSPYLSHGQGTNDGVFEGTHGSCRDRCDSSSTQTWSAGRTAFVSADSKSPRSASSPDDCEGTIVASDETDWSETTITAL